MKTGIYILLEILVFGLTYGGVIVIILTYLKLFKKQLNKLSIFLPLIIMGFLFILLIIFQLSWDDGYAGLYVLLVSIIGLGLHVLIFCCIYLLIRCRVKDMSNWYWLWIGLTLICFIPVLFSLYGFINPLNSLLTEVIALKYGIVFLENSSMGEFKGLIKQLLKLKKFLFLILNIIQIIQ